jgi:hypothetical protein
MDAFNVRRTVGVYLFRNHATLLDSDEIQYDAVGQIIVKHKCDNWDKFKTCALYK